MPGGFGAIPPGEERDYFRGDRLPDEEDPKEKKQGEGASPRPPTLDNLAHPTLDSSSAPAVPDADAEEAGEEEHSEEGPLKMTADRGVLGMSLQSGASSLLSSVDYGKDRTAPLFEEASLLDPDERDEEEDEAERALDPDNLEQLSRPLRDPKEEGDHGAVDQGEGPEAAEDCPEDRSASSDEDEEEEEGDENEETEGGDKRTSGSKEKEEEEGSSEDGSDSDGISIVGEDVDRDFFAARGLLPLVDEGLVDLELDTSDEEEEHAADDVREWFQGPDCLAEQWQEAGGAAQLPSPAAPMGGEEEEESSALLGANSSLHSPSLLTQQSSSRCPSARLTGEEGLLSRVAALSTPRPPENRWHRFYGTPNSRASFTVKPVPDSDEKLSFEKIDIRGALSARSDLVP